MFTAYLFEIHRLWDRYLAKVAYATRSAKRDVTIVTPNFAMFGRDIYIGNDLESDSAHNSSTVDNGIVRKGSLDKLFKDIQSRLKYSYDKSKVRHNSRHRQQQLQVNPIV